MLHILVAINSTWQELRQDQIEAVTDVLETHSTQMYTMGGYQSHRWERKVGQSSSTGIHYVCYLDIIDDKVWVQLGDTLFHRILVIPDAPLDIDASFFRE